MPVSVVVGGQFGSEGKGKVSLATVRRSTRTSIAVRPGGTNSGHTAYTRDGRRLVLRQLPAACVDGEVDVIIPAGGYVDPELLAIEIAVVGIDPRRVLIDPRAHLIGRDHVAWERDAGLVGSIGSTGSGTGAAVMGRMARYAPGLPVGVPALECETLRPHLADTVSIMRAAIGRGERIVVEGTQGFGLSPIHGDAWPKATSRDTTAAAFLSETGLAVSDVDDVVLVIRCHPIRVAGDSGPLLGETTWDEIARRSGGPWERGEMTSVTGRLRRVGLFDADLVRRAIAVNQPTRIVLNHLDQIDFGVTSLGMTERGARFVRDVEAALGRPVDEIGLSPTGSVQWNELLHDSR